MVFLPNGQLPAQPPDAAFPQSILLTYSEVQNINSRAVAYIASEFSDKEFPANGQFVIGDRNQPNNDSSQYTNGPLRGGEYYTFFLRAYPKLGTAQKRATVSPVQHSINQYTCN